MKSTIKSNSNDKKKLYPWIGISDNDSRIIVLFISEGKGVCLGSAESAYGIGRLGESWNESGFIRQDAITIAFES